MKKGLQLLLFIGINILLADSFILILPIIGLMLLLFPNCIYNPKDANICQLIGFALSILKLFILVIYYKFCYKKVKCPLLIKFMELQKCNKYHFRVIFLFIIFMPYFIMLFFSPEIKYNYIDMLAVSCMYISLSALLPNIVFFCYLDLLESKVKNCSSITTNMLRMTVSVLISLFIMGYAIWMH